MEEAINIVVEGDGMSVNNMYGSLIREESHADVNIFHDDDENVECFLETSSKTQYTVNVNLTEKLKNCKEQFIDSSSMCGRIPRLSFKEMRMLLRIK